jgi:aldose 1-epimerase
MNKLSFLALAALMAGCCCNTDDVKPFGTTKFGEKATLYTLKSPDGLTLEITDFGGRLVRCWAPDREGKLADVTLGWNTVGEYETLGFSMGTLIGR